MQKFLQKKFDLDYLSDPFFDTLKSDYPEFSTWYEKKVLENETAYIYQEGGIKAFLYLKDEYGEKSEQIVLDSGVLPAESRIKIGTLKLLDTVQGMRLGEGQLVLLYGIGKANP